MKETLKPGLTFEFCYTIPEEKTVPYLYPDSEEMQLMPKVFATGYMVGLFEWACIQALKPHLDWPQEQTLGIHVNLSHEEATPPGFPITVKGKLDTVDGRKLTFSLEADDGIDRVSTGIHERFVINYDKFNEKVSAKINNYKEKESR